MEWSPALFYGAIAATANILGGLWISSKPVLNQRILKYLIAIGAGFMLAAVFLEVLPVSLSQPNVVVTKVMLLVLAGYLSVQFFEHTMVSHFHFGEETHTHVISRRSAFTTLAGLGIHTFFDGVSIASGFAINIKLGLIIFFAIILHKLPEGFTVASVMLAAGHSRSTARWATVTLGLATFIGSITIVVFKSTVDYALPVSAGVTLYVAASDLIPEVNHGHDEKLAVSLAVFGGVALYYLTDRLLDLVHIG